MKFYLNINRILFFIDMSIFSIARLLHKSFTSNFTFLSNDIMHLSE